MKENKLTYKQLKHYYDTTCGLWAIDRSPQEVDMKWITENAFRLGDLQEEEKPEVTKEIKIPDGYEFSGIENGKVVLKRKKPDFSELPRTFHECEAEIGAVDLSESKSLFYTTKGKEKAVSSLLKLIVCRDAWWKILNWKPNWGCNNNNYKFFIGSYDGEITNDMTSVHVNRILAFPTVEVRDKFFEVFKDYIEEAKEFL